MKPKLLAPLAILALASAVLLPTLFEKPATAAAKVPRFEPDPTWPKPLPKKWMISGIGGIFVDAKDHIWVANRPRSLQGNDTYGAKAT